METRTRTMLKSLTWQMLGIVTMTALGYSQIGSLSGALSIAFSASAMGFVFFFVHERVWSRIGWGLVATGSGKREGRNQSR
jgi:uncharacterized membrane protein